MAAALFASLLLIAPVALWKLSQHFDVLSEFFGAESQWSQVAQTRLVIAAFLVWYFGVVPAAYYHTSRGDWHSAFVIVAMLTLTIFVLAGMLAFQARGAPHAARWLCSRSPRGQSIVVVAVVLFFSAVFGALAVMSSPQHRVIALVVGVVMIGTMLYAWLNRSR